MPSRADIVRHILSDWLGGLSEHAADDFEIEGDSGLRLGLLQRTFFPDLVVTVDELLELPDDRILTRLTVQSRDRPDALHWPAAAIFRFQGDQVKGVWSVTDHMPWMYETGLLDTNEFDRRFDELLREREGGSGGDRGA